MMANTQLSDMSVIKIRDREFRLPSSRWARVVLGVVLVVCGVLGFLPVLGFWMIPLGLVVLSIDFPAVRRRRRQMQIKIGRWWQRRGSPARGG